MTCTKHLHKDTFQSHFPTFLFCTISTAGAEITIHCFEGFLFLLKMMVFFYHLNTIISKEDSHNYKFKLPLSSRVLNMSQCYYCQYENTINITNEENYHAAAGHHLKQKRRIFQEQAVYPLPQRSSWEKATKISKFMFPQMTQISLMTVC